MTRFDNNAEGGVNGGQVAAADTGSGDQFTQVTGGSTMTYSSSSPLSGTLSYVFSTTATQFVSWTDGVSASGAIRFEFSLPSAPSGGAHRLLDIRSSSASLGNVTVLDATTTLTANSGSGASGTSPATTSLTPGTKYTGTYTFANWGTASSTATIKIYDASGALLDTKTATAGTTAVAPDRMRLGRPAGTTTLATGLKIDNIAMDFGNGGVEIPPAAPPSFSGSAAFTGDGTLTYAATVTVSGTRALSGAGSLTANGSPSAAGSLPLSGSGTLVGVGSPSLSGTLSTSGSGTLAPVGRPTVSGAAGLSGSGSLTASGTPSAAGALGTSGTGTLTFSAAGSGAGSVALSGTGTLSLQGSPGASGTVLVTGSGTLSPSGSPTTSGSRALTGAGTLSLSGSVGGTGGALTLSGSGQLGGAPSGLSIAGAIGLSGIGALSLFGQPAGALTGALALSGDGVLVGTGRPTTSGGLQLGGIGYFAKAPGVQVGFTPSNEMVAVAWLKAAVPYLGNRVATELPSDNSSWSASGFTTVATTGGTPNTEVPVNEPVMSIDSWGVTPQSGRPPWNLAAQPAEAIKAAAVEHGMIPRILTFPAGFNLVRVFSVIPRSEPRRINSDAASYAHYTQDLEFRWVKS